MNKFNKIFALCVIFASITLLTDHCFGALGIVPRVKWITQELEKNNAITRVNFNLSFKDEKIEVKENTIITINCQHTVIDEVDWYKLQSGEVVAVAKTSMLKDGRIDDFNFSVLEDAKWEEASFDLPVVKNNEFLSLNETGIEAKVHWERPYVSSYKIADTDEKTQEDNDEMIIIFRESSVGYDYLLAIRCVNNIK